MPPSMTKSKRRQRPQSAPSSPVTNNREIPQKKSATPPTRRTSLPGRASVSKKNPPRRLIFQSPRCDLPDQKVFPVAASIWKEHEVRWKSLSAQAGSHQQDGSILTVQPRMTPQALKLGMPTQAASRVKILKLPETGEGRLPEWLDVVASTFENLEHLFMSGNQKEHTEERPAAAAEEEHVESPSNSLRLRRLYILYRLPNLLSIDGRPVTSDERQFARPDHPNGQRVKREDWVEDGPPLLPSPHHAVEVGLDGAAHLRSKSKEGEEKDDWLSSSLPPSSRSRSSGCCMSPRHAVEVELDGNVVTTKPSSPSVKLCADDEEHAESLVQSPRRQVEVRLDEDEKKAAVTPRPSVEVKLGGRQEAKDIVATPADKEKLEEGKKEPSQCQCESAQDAVSDDSSCQNEDVVTSSLEAVSLGCQEDKANEPHSNGDPSVQSPSHAVEVHLNDTSPLVDIDLTPNTVQEEVVEVSPPCDMPVLDEKKDDLDLPVRGFLPHKDSLELDRFEYVSVESSTHCDWSAACGSLSIPYFRGDNARRLKLTAENSKSRFRLGFRRRRKPKPLDPSAFKKTPRAAREKLDGNAKAASDKSLLDDEEPEEAPRVLNLDASSASDRPNREIFHATVTPPRPMRTSIQVGNSPPIPEHQVVDQVMIPPGQNHPSLSALTADSFPPSPSQRIPASKSLTSPFPMQFRARAKKSMSPNRELSVTTKLNSTDESPNRPSPPPAPRQQSPSLHTISTAIDQPVPLTRVQSSPSKLGRRSGDLPPPCPGRRRRVPSPPATRRKKKDFSKWKQKLSARSSSIMDDEDEDCSSDEENLTVKEAA